MQMPPLKTERLLIRSFEVSDFAVLHAILDVEPGHVAPDDAAALATASAERRQWLEWSVLNYPALAHLHQPPYGDRAIVLRATEEVIGACGFAPVLLPFGQLLAFRTAETASGQPVRNTNEMGLYWEVSARQRRRGYASEAGAALIRYAFTALNLQRIVATTEYDNAASIGVMRKLGMLIERNPLPEPSYMQIVGILENRDG
jgi:RimJ/RimL family protein N-acetyltransferase